LCTTGALLLRVLVFRVRVDADGKRGQVAGLLALLVGLGLGPGLGPGDVVVELGSLAPLLVDDVVPQAVDPLARQLLGLGGQRVDARGRPDLERLAALVAAAAGLASIHALPLQSV
jgi:hypothetical protein